VRAGAIQLNATDDTDRNLQTADRLVRQAASLGAELGIDLLAGSLFERGETPEKGYNTSVHVGPDGELRAVYRKIRTGSSPCGAPR
jgi:predicted amidohydrolase